MRDTSRTGENEGNKKGQSVKTAPDPAFELLRHNEAGKFLTKAGELPILPDSREASGNRSDAFAFVLEYVFIVSPSKNFNS